MELERDFYLQFYPVLLFKFSQKAYPENIVKSDEKLSPDLWRAFDSVAKKLKVAVFFAGSSGGCGRDYFYSRYLAFVKDSKKKVGKIDALTLFKALVFVGVDKGKKLDNGLILDFDSLHLRNEWHKVNSHKLIHELIDLFKKDPEKYKQEKKDLKNTTVDLTETKSEPLSVYKLLDVDLKTFLNYSITLSEKQLLLDYIFDASTPDKNRLSVLKIFAVQRILTDKEIVQLLREEITFKHIVDILPNLISSENNTPLLCVSMVNTYLNNITYEYSMFMLLALEYMNFEAVPSQLRRLVTLENLPKVYYRVLSQKLATAFHGYLKENITAKYSFELLEYLSALLGALIEMNEDCQDLPYDDMGTEVHDDLARLDFKFISLDLDFQMKVLTGEIIEAQKIYFYLERERVNKKNQLKKSGNYEFWMERWCLLQFKPSSMGNMFENLLNT